MCSLLLLTLTRKPICYSENHFLYMVSHTLHLSMNENIVHFSSRGYIRMKNKLQPDQNEQDKKGNWIKTNKSGKRMDKWWEGQGGDSDQMVAAWRPEPEGSSQKLQTNNISVRQTPNCHFCLHWIIVNKFEI